MVLNVLAMFYRLLAFPKRIVPVHYRKDPTLCAYLNGLGSKAQTGGG